MTSRPTILTGTKRARTRDQLLVSAQALLMEHSAAGLGLRQITDHAGVVHATFYNYYPDVPALIADLGELLGATHVAAMSGLGAAQLPPDVRFARITRQTLRLVAQAAGLGRLMFDVGIPPDRLSAELRLRLRQDLAEGRELGLFSPDDIELTTSMIAGAITGLALDLYRGTLPASAIDTGTARLLMQIGVPPPEAKRLAHEPLPAPPTTVLPMRWLALPPAGAPPEGRP
jgi:AcrR family transcriptional regulator